MGTSRRDACSSWHRTRGATRDARLGAPSSRRAWRGSSRGGAPSRRGSRRMRPRLRPTSRRWRRSWASRSTDAGRRAARLTRRAASPSAAQRRAGALAGRRAVASLVQLHRKARLVAHLAVQVAGAVGVDDAAALTISAGLAEAAGAASRTTAGTRALVAHAAQEGPSLAAAVTVDPALLAPAARRVAGVQSGVDRVARGVAAQGGWQSPMVEPAKSGEHTVSGRRRSRRR